EDTGMRGWMGHVAVYGGGVFDKDGNGGAASVEIGATPFELDKWHTQEAPFEAQPRIWIRPSIGVMATEDFHPLPGRKRVVPLYGEIQFFPWQGKGGFGAVQIGIGPRVELAYEDAGIQSTVCAGVHVFIMMICARGAYLANRGPEFGLFI